jgi:hypothetical protein
MLDRADARLWFPMIGIAGAVPAVVFAISAIWFMRFYFAPPTILAAAPLGSSALAQVEVAVPPPPAVPVSPPLAAQTPKPLSTMPRLGDAHPAYSDPAQDISTVVSAAMSAKPAALEPSEPIADPVPPALAEAEAPAPQLRQRPTETAEAIAALPPTPKRLSSLQRRPRWRRGCMASRIPLIPIQRRTFRPVYPRLCLPSPPRSNPPRRSKGRSHCPGRSPVSPLSTSAARCHWRDRPPPQVARARPLAVRPPSRGECVAKHRVFTGNDRTGLCGLATPKFGANNTEARLGLFHFGPALGS